MSTMPIPDRSASPRVSHPEMTDFGIGGEFFQ
jgi:hypothetical protein